MTTNRIVSLALSCALLTSVAHVAQAQTSANAVARYRVTLSLLPGDSAEVISRQIAGTYRARLEPFAEEGFTGFMATMSEAAVELLRRDPHVAKVERLGSGSSPAAPSFPQPVPAAAAAPVAAAGPAVRPLQTASWSLSYGYDGSGNIRSINSQPYVYDELGRVKSAPTQDSHIQAYTYDRYGNILTITTDTDLVGQQKIGVKAATNQASEKDPPYNVYGDYDAAGNMIKYLGFDEFTYDGTGMVTRANVQGVEQAYVYTADDERIATITVVSGAEQSSEWTIRSLSGEVLRRVSRSGGEWSWDRDYIYGDGLLAAETSGPEKTLHFHLDHLGTPRLITGNGGAKVSLHHYHAFGRESSDPAQDNERKKFTGHERDFASLDYMHARYYNPFMGRFLSLDPALDMDGSLKSPQMWNRYAYVLNNPIRFTDPTGKYVCKGNADGCKTVEVAIEVMKQAAAQMKKNDPQRAKLKAVIDAYGKPNDPNSRIGTVWVNPQKVDGTQLLGVNSLGQAGRQGNMFLSLINVGLKGAGDSRKSFAILAGVMAHEGLHELQPAVVGLPQGQRPSLLSMLHNELQAYTLERALYGGINMSSLTQDPTRAAWASATAGCAQSGCVP
jgi:RHS repeat-associated protein